MKSGQAPDRQAGRQGVVVAVAAKWGRPQQGTLETLCEWVSAVVSLADPVGQSHQAEQLFLGTATATAWEVPGMVGGEMEQWMCGPVTKVPSYLFPLLGRKATWGCLCFPYGPAAVKLTPG